MGLNDFLSSFADSYGSDFSSDGTTQDESTDLGITSPTEQGSPQLPAVAGAQLGMLTTSPQSVTRKKCPRGYTLVQTPTTMLGMAGGATCVLTKVARALGLARRRRGKGISSRDLRAALRVQRLVHRLAPKFGARRHASTGRKK